MRQLSFLVIDGADAVGDGEQNYPYRIDSRGYFVVTATVPGVGRLTARERFLSVAYDRVRDMVKNAHAARPDSMF